MSSGKADANREPDIRLFWVAWRFRALSDKGTHGQVMSASDLPKENGYAGLQV